MWLDSGAEQLGKKNLTRVRASGEPQSMYPLAAAALRTTYLVKRGIDHLRHLDFSTIPGYTGYVFWKIGQVEFWSRRVISKIDKPDRPIRLT